MEEIKITPIFIRCLQQLNDIVPELYQQAYSRYTQEGNDLLNQYNMAYGRYRDAVGDWENERSYADSDYWQRYNADYADYQNQRKQESRNVYKTHRILMPDGSTFEYNNNAEPSTARGVARNGSYASPISSASTSIVAESPEDVKFSLRPTDTPQFKRWFEGSKVINADGSPKILYHQTNADFTEFDVGRQGAGYNDSEMPSGIYMKEFPDTIKLGVDYKSSIQMALYASIQRPLVFEDRAAAKRHWEKNVPGYAELSRELDELNARYGSL